MTLPSKRFITVASIALCVFPFCRNVVAQRNEAELDRRYNALAWMQNAAEYRLLCEQTYRHALSQLVSGLNDKKWSADEVQDFVGDFSEKPPAVILDCDETVLDNSAYNARNILQGQNYSTESWNQWCQEGKANAIPGALQFVKSAQALGVQVYYITNRRDVVKDATVKNLKNLGFPATHANVLTKNADRGRGDDKVTRRAMVAEKYRIVLLVGDSLSDLCSGMDGKTADQRNRIADRKSEFLGSRWIIMPNPVYGGWERALPSGGMVLDPQR
jgi:5'-nucleotidase (lipoprotein e(P4) family)